MEAFVYVRTAPGEALDLLETIKEIEGVKSAAATTGRFDIVAKVGSEDMESLGDKIVGEIHDLGSVEYTETAPIVAQ